MLDFKLPNNAILHIYASYPCEESLGISDLKFVGRDCDSIRKSVEHYINDKLLNVESKNDNLKNKGFYVETITPIWHDILCSVECLTIDIVYVSCGSIRISNVGKVSSLPVYTSNVVAPVHRYVDILLEYIYDCIDIDKLNCLVDSVDTYCSDTYGYALYASKYFSAHHGSNSLLLITPSLGNIKESVKDVFTNTYNKGLNCKSTGGAYDCIVNNCFRALYKISKTINNDFTFEYIEPKSTILFDVIKKDLPLNMCVDYYVKCLIG